MAPSMLCGGAGFPEQTCCPGLADTHPPAAPPHALPRGPAGSRGDAGTGAQSALHASPLPTRVPAPSGPVLTLAAGSRTSPAAAQTSRSDLPPRKGPSPEPRGRRSSRSGRRAFLAQHGWAPPRPPARPARHLIRLRSRAEPLFRLPGLAFPGSGVGEGRRESFRHFQPPPPVPPPREGGCGRLPRLPSRELRATRGAAPGGGRRAGLAPTQRARQEAVPSPVEPPGKETGPRQDGWVWIVVLFFLFVAFLGTKKKAQPFTPLHLHLSAPEAWLHRFGETETTVYPAPHSRDGWDEHSCWNQCLVSS